MYHIPAGIARKANTMAQPINMHILTLNVLLISIISPFPIATAKKRLQVEIIMVLNTLINVIMLPTTENNP